MKLYIPLQWSSFFECWLNFFHLPQKLTDQWECRLLVLGWGWIFNHCQARNYYDKTLSSNKQVEWKEVIWLMDLTPHFWTVVYISCKYVGDIYVDICVCLCCTCFVCPVSVEMSAAWFHDLLCSKVISSGVSIPVYCGVIYTLGMSCLRH